MRKMKHVEATEIAILINFNELEIMRGEKVTYLRSSLVTHFMPITKLAHVLPDASRPHHSTLVDHNFSHINTQNPRTRVTRR